MLTVIITGLAIGSLYAAAALVYNLMYSSSKVLSVTTGHICMLGGVCGAYFIGVLKWPIIAGLLLSVAIGMIVGLLTEIVAVRRIVARSSDHLWILSTLAFGSIIQQTTLLAWGTEPRPFPRLIPQDYSAGMWDQKFWLPIVCTLGLAAAIHLFMHRTMYGKLFSAMSQDEFAARARGVPTERIRAASYAAAGGLGSIAGFAAGQLTYAYFAVGLMLTLNGFIALAVGGIGSNVGALVGGALLGVFTALASYYFGGEYQQTMCLGLLMLILLIKPSGLFGTREARPV